MRMTVLGPVLLTIACLAVSALLPARVRGQGVQRTVDTQLKTFLQDYVEKRAVGDYTRTQYSAAVVHLGPEGTGEAIAYLSGDGWCGSGGCTTLVLAREGMAWRVITKIPVTWPPIRVLPTRTHGWRDISVRVRGGGVRPAYDAVLRFDGKSYPMNPSAPPARPASGPPKGEVVIPISEGLSPLYP
jgi:hypothetical protein